jgi:hypothetical protein
MEHLRKQETDLQLVMNVKNLTFDNESLKELVSRHAPIFYKIKQRFAKGKNQENFLEDLSLNIDLLFYNVCIKFDPERKCKFTSMLTNEIRWMFLNAWKKHKSRTFKLDPIEDHVKFLEDQALESEDLDEGKKSEILNRFRELVAAHKDKRVVEIFNLRYSEGKKVTPWRIIAKKIGLTMPGCIYIHDKHVKEINALLKKELILC